jgi:hypothetical protein
MRQPARPFTLAEHEHEVSVLNKFCAAKRAGLIHGIPKSAGIWGSRGRYRLGWFDPEGVQKWRNVSLRDMESMIAETI